jgi:hypothetical protein
MFFSHGVIFSTIPHLPHSMVGNGSFTSSLIPPPVSRPEECLTSGEALILVKELILNPYHGAILDVVNRL